MSLTIPYSNHFFHNFNLHEQYIVSRITHCVYFLDKQKMSKRKVLSIVTLHGIVNFYDTKSLPEILEEFTKFKSINR